MHVRLLRDTGALQSLVCSRVLTDTDYTPTGEFRLIRGITGEVISVPLVKVTLSGSLCKATFLCGLVSTLPEGIAVLVSVPPLPLLMCLSSLGRRRHRPNSQLHRTFPHQLTLLLRRRSPTNRLLPIVKWTTPLTCRLCLTRPLHSHRRPLILLTEQN